MEQNHRTTHQYRMKDFEQEFKERYEWYQQTLFDVAVNNAFSAWNTPIREENRVRRPFTIGLPISRLSIPIYAGLALWKAIRSIKEKSDHGEVIDLYSIDKIHWGF